VHSIEVKEVNILSKPKQLNTSVRISFAV